ncbi:uncharacterized protein EMH_0099540 [Eimeria mitis]|uniref:Uncharacterized protein n=1 Tax=Eimeria mitis TaxID=44415 RepID=U6KJP0_9EIME|nr:uncharacterized protein EMH_0099540 [Eimeria mitis]CDJ35668.1 hypothetical protein, conserved [Eimeria mitis]
MTAAEALASATSYVEKPEAYGLIEGGSTEGASAAAAEDTHYTAAEEAAAAEDVGTAEEEAAAAAAGAPEAAVAADVAAVPAGDGADRDDNYQRPPFMVKPKGLTGFERGPPYEEDLWGVPLATAQLQSCRLLLWYA